LAAGAAQLAEGIACREPSHSEHQMTASAALSFAEAISFLRVTREGVESLFDLPRETIDELEATGVLVFEADGQATAPGVARAIFKEACYRAEQAFAKAEAARSVALSIAKLSEKLLDDTRSIATPAWNEALARHFAALEAALDAIAPALYSPIGSQREVADGA
jgi:hypothetical protein